MKNKLPEIAIFDGQVFQSAAWERGMGKYSLGFLNSLSTAQKTYSKIYIIFNKDLNLTHEIRKTIKEASPKAEHVFLDLRVPKVEPKEDIKPLKISNQDSLSGYIEESFGSQKVDFILLSLFIDQVCSVFPTNINVRKILLFYDLIPLQYSARYSQSWSYPNYLERFSEVFEANRILTISQTVADDLIVYTGIDSEKIQNIDGAPIDRSSQAAKKPNINLPKRYILMPSGNEIRKNNFRAAEAFEKFRALTGNNDYKLVLTSYFDAKTERDLLQTSSNLIFTGNVTESELDWLYGNTEAVLFVSEYEGLGLPLLEAVEANKPVVCSNLKVFNEMTSSAFYYTNEYSPSSIASSLQRATSKVEFSEKKSQYPAIRREYKWEKTADKALEFLARTQQNKLAIKNKKKIAIFAPSPTGYSAIGKVVALTHPALCEYFEIDYFIEHARSDNNFSRPSYLENIASVRPAKTFTAKDYAAYYAVIYHMGNSEYHLETIKNALHLPGYVIFHDTKLKEVFEDELFKHAYIEKGRLSAERKLDSISKNSKTLYATSLANSCLGVIAHSTYAKQALSLLVSEQLTHKINLPVGTPLLKKKKIDNKFLVGFAGIIHKAKGIDIINDIVSSSDSFDIDLHVFGVPMTAPGELERLESLGNIKIEKSLSDFEFENRLAEMDVIISFRPNYNGETSLTVLEAMRNGVVPIVRRVGWFDEIPDECVEKVTNEADVVEAIRKLKNNPEYLKNKQKAAKEYVEKFHNYRQYAQDLHSIIEQEKSTENTLNYKTSAYLKQGKSKEEILKLINN